MEKKMLKYQTAWRRLGEPLITPNSEFGKSITMNPYAVQKDNDIYLFYAADDDEGKRQIRLVVFKDGDFNNLVNYGPVIQNGEWGSFDGAWCVLPNVVYFKGKWHLYYSGNRGMGEGLSRFPGLGLATSDDLIHWEKYPDNPLISPSGIDGTPDAIGIAGGGVLVLPNGKLRWYYTGCPTYGEELFLHQQKNVCVAESEDGIHWEKLGAVMGRMFDRNYRDIASGCGPVYYEDNIFKIWHPCIGTRWGFYSICYGESEDGFNWNVGECYGDEIAFGPRTHHIDITEKYYLWDAQNVSYPTTFKKDGKRYMFYCGNEYGRGGIGLAVACNSRVYARETELIAVYNGEEHDVDIKAFINGIEVPKSKWSMPDSDCNIWREACVEDINVRLIVTHTVDGIKVFLTAIAKNEPVKAELFVNFGNLKSGTAVIELEKHQSKSAILEINLD